MEQLRDYRALLTGVGLWSLQNLLEHGSAGVEAWFRVEGYRALDRALALRNFWGGVPVELRVEAEGFTVYCWFRRRCWLCSGT